MVNLCSNAAGVHPIPNASRYSCSEKKRMQIEQPYLVKLYNENMGGIDRMDQNISNYRTAMRGKSGIFAWFPICLIIPSTMHDDCKKFVMKIRCIYYTFEEILPGLTCLSMPSRLIKDCEVDLNKLYLIFVIMVITIGLYLKSSKLAALIAMQKPLQDVKNLTSDFM